MKRLSDFFYAKTNGWVCLLLTGVMVIYASLVLGGTSADFQSQLPEGMKVLGLKTGYSYEYALNLFQALDPEGLQSYQRFILRWDVIFPLIYGAMYLAWVSLLYKKVSFRFSFTKYLNLFPLVLIVLDWKENFFENRLVNQFLQTGSLMERDVAIASFFNQVKWSGSMINYLILIVGVILFFKKMIRK